jgi:farnesyl diphosphate synthase
MAETATAIDHELGKILPEKQDRQGKLIKSLRYSAIGGGKRLRPFLTMQSAYLFSVPHNQALCVATAVELVHCYSLVHDDLPAMDNDDWRRGKPTNHKVFGDALAILTGDGLLTMAFQLLNQPDTGMRPEIRSELTFELAKAAGIGGMIGGQAIDIQAQHQPMAFSDIEYLQTLKTGALIGFAVDAGAILSSASKQHRRALAQYANALGLAFQIIDDLLDTEGDEIDVGKQLRKDRGAGKATLVNALGPDKARDRARDMTEEALLSLKEFGPKAQLLREVATFLFSRTH